MPVEELPVGAMTPKVLRLLIVEDTDADAEVLLAELVRAGFSPRWSRVDTPERFVEALFPAPSLILCSDSVPGLDVLAVLGILRELSRDVPVIVITGTLDEESCVKSLRMGADDYLLKDRLARLGPAVEQALANRLLAQQKRAAERKERETASILRAVIAHAPAAISVKAVDGRYLLSNQQFERLCGPGTGSLAGQIDAELFATERAREMIDLDARCLHNSRVVEREEVFPEPGGARHMLSVRYPVIGDDNEVFGIGAIYVDITRQKEIEAQLRAARVETVSRAEQLRTPLTSIRGYLEVLRETETDLGAEKGRRFLSIIERDSEQLLNLIDDLLVLSRLDVAGPPDQDLPVAQVVAAAVEILRPAVRRAGLTLSLEIEDDLPPVAGDRDQLERVVLNLLSNAVKFSSVAEGARLIVVTVSARDGGVSLAVSDEGIGITPEDRSRLFTRFFRTDHARRMGIPGAGLGLAVVKGIVEGHGGAVGVDSMPGRGTTITVLLPPATGSRSLSASH